MRNTTFFASLDYASRSERLYQMLVDNKNGNLELDDVDLFLIEEQLSNIEDANMTPYFNIFQYMSDDLRENIITSRNDCDTWIRENAETIQWVGDMETLNKFWDEYPNGYILFG
jgi:hypothetical protein